MTRHDLTAYELQMEATRRMHIRDDRERRRKRAIAIAIAWFVMLAAAAFGVGFATAPLWWGRI